MHTVELLLDADLDTGVRALWDRLAAARLPSLATHPHPTNRPHLTVITAATLAGLPPLALPIEAELGPADMLGRALVRKVVPTPALHAAYATAWTALGEADAWPPPESWVPHVSLALKVPPDRRAEALRLLSDLPPAYGRFVAARSYDTETRTVTKLPV